MTQTARTLAAAWGLTGVLALLLHATHRLGTVAAEGLLHTELTLLHWAILVPWTIFCIYTEAWRGFHLRFSPRVVIRARHLAQEGSLLEGLLAPAFCMSLVGANKKGTIVAWALVTMIVTLVLSVRALSQPWRGIVDAGVFIALGLGLISILWFLGRLLAGNPHEVAPDLRGT